MNKPACAETIAMYATLHLEHNAIWRLMLSGQDVPASPGQGAVAGASDVVAL